MHLVIDKSNLFKFDLIPPMKWRVVTMGGAILPYEGRKIWLKSHKAIRKGSDYITQESISDVLDILIKCRVKGILRIGDTGHVSLKVAEMFRQNWVSPHYDYGMLNRNICENRCGFTSITLWERGSKVFFKIVNILDTITRFIQWLTQSLPHISDMDPQSMVQQLIERLF